VSNVLIVSRFRDKRPDTLNLQKLEKNCLAVGSWESCHGPVLFEPTKVSTRFFAAFHVLTRTLLRLIRSKRVVISLGLPYRHYLLGKTFPHFAVEARLRVLWTYDVWEPRFEEIAALVREARVGLLLLTSRQGTEYFRALNLPDCTVHWVPEALEVSDYQCRPWSERTIDVLSFGRSHPSYHSAIAAECEVRGLRYVFQQWDTAEELVEALGKAKMSICFPQAVTNPERVGGVSTVTLRYLQSMASKSVIVGNAPLEAEEMFGYNPVVEVDWDDPVGQLQLILRSPDAYLDLVERNYAAVVEHHQTGNLVRRIDALIAAKLANQRQ